MKKIHKVVSFVFIVVIIYWSFYALLPKYNTDEQIIDTQFSTKRALQHVEAISKKPHHVGTAAHAEVRVYLVNQLKELGLSVSIQEGYNAGDWGNLSKATNIIAKIPGSGNGKALLLLSHYDSRGHSSYGASDAASGVATILEGVRTFLKQQKTPKNDIIILFSDAEELGLNGARLFAENHPLIKNIGLILNFEARGSGGPAYMLIETNKGNSALIKNFVAANPQYPVGNSLAYSIYKMLPNDTDLTVFREEADIEGFNFAFIDDHFDYHTALDTYNRLDRNTLKHQGSYLMPLLDYFSNNTLNQLKSTEDYVYFNVPVFKLVAYPYTWIFPMLIVAVLVFVLLLVYGIKQNIINISEVGKGFMAFIISIVICGVIGYFSWKILKIVYPQYQDILHGFPYNGHTYIAVFVFLSIAICFWVYKKITIAHPANGIIAPVFFWLVICFMAAIYLKGASFFIIPVYGTLASLLVVINQKKPNLLLLVFLSIPALWIVSPFIQMFPVGLGLKLMVSVTVMVVLLFGLLTPALLFYKSKKMLGFLSFLMALLFFGKAHFQSGFSADTPKPNSLLYVLNTDNNTAQWVTYDTFLDDWTLQFIDPEKNKQTTPNTTLSSKYSTGFSYAATAPAKHIKPPLIEKYTDTVINNKRILEFCITPQRKVHQLELFVNNNLPLYSCKVNGISLSVDYLKKLKERLITHYISNNDATDVYMEVPVNMPVSLTLFEASTDLLSHSLFSVPKRPQNTIPMPFVLNDAVVVTKNITF